MKEQYQVSALYHFVRLENFEALKQPLLDCMIAHNVKGTLLLANEGINGTIAGPPSGVQAVFDHLKSDPRLIDIRSKESFTDTPPFYRSKVKLKKEIVTMGVPGTDPQKIVGTYVKPDEWNDLISDPDVVLVDTRNDYEVEIGTFKGAIDPKTTNFRDFPDWVQRNHNVLSKPKVAMFCTGGIRCEKSTAYMKEQGYEDVYHLEGGILKYLEEVPKEESLWEGECFVFDNRVSVKHGLEEGSYDQCYGCRWPITEEDMKSEHYIKGVCCPRCYKDTPEEKKQRSAERQQQIERAKERGEQHIAINMKEVRTLAQEKKIQEKKAQAIIDQNKATK